MLEKHRLKESDYLVKAQDPPDLIAPRTPLLLLRPLGQVPAPRPGQALCRGGPGLAQWRQPAAQLSGINPHTADSVLGPAQRPTVPFLPPPFLPSSPGSGRLGAEDKHATLGAARPDQP